jgi:hypothetical protein
MDFPIANRFTAGDKSVGGPPAEMAFYSGLPWVGIRPIPARSSGHIASFVTGL